MKNILNEESFRISGKRILLTYSQAVSRLSLHHVLEQLQCKVGRFHYVISQEKHDDGIAHLACVFNKFSIKMY